MNEEIFTTHESLTFDDVLVVPAYYDIQIMERSDSNVDGILNVFCRDHASHHVFFRKRPYFPVFA